MAQMPLAPPAVVVVRAQPGLVAPGQQVVGEPGELGVRGLVSSDYGSASDPVSTLRLNPCNWRSPFFGYRAASTWSGCARRLWQCPHMRGRRILGEYRATPPCGSSAPKEARTIVSMATCASPRILRMHPISARYWQAS